MGLKIAMSEGMLLEKAGKFFQKKVDDGYKVFDLFICPWCAGTLQAITAHAFAFGLGILPMEWNWQLLIRYPLIVMGASFLSGNVWNLYETINRIKERNELEVEHFRSIEN